MNKFSKVLKKAKSFAVMAERAEQEYKKVFAQTPEIERDKPYMVGSKELFSAINNFKTNLTNAVGNLRSINQVLMDKDLSMNQQAHPAAYQFSNVHARSFIKLAYDILGDSNDTDVKSHLKMEALTLQLGKLINFVESKLSDVDGLNLIVAGLKKQAAAMKVDADKVRKFADVKSNWTNPESSGVERRMIPGSEDLEDYSKTVQEELNRKSPSSVPANPKPSAPKPSKPSSGLSS